MRTYGAKVTPSPSMTTDIGKMINKKFPETTGSLGCAISEAVEVATKTEGYRYVLGSVLNYALFREPSSDQYTTVLSSEKKIDKKLQSSFPKTL